MKRASRAKTSILPMTAWQIGTFQIPLTRERRYATLVLRDADRYRKRAEKQMNPSKTGRHGGRNPGYAGSSLRRDFED